MPPSSKSNRRSVRSGIRSQGPPSVQQSPLAANMAHTQAIMDNMDIPEAMLSQLSQFVQLGPEVKKWRDLRAWVGQNPNALPLQIKNELEPWQRREFQDLTDEQWRTIALAQKKKNAWLQRQNQAVPPTAVPSGAAPSKSTLTALPTVRDHTTDQLNETNDEYIPREIDESGEKKVMTNGQLLGNRTYKCRTFLVPHRGDKLFMLATECARVLGYRDSYLLFNKNRSLYKIVANQMEKDNLVQEKIIPFSHRSRQLAIVTARSMFRQFGSRVIEGGRRVDDDYWTSSLAR
jgi:hypothetical protein